MPLLAPPPAPTPVELTVRLPANRAGRGTLRIAVFRAWNHPAHDPPAYTRSVPLSGAGTTLRVPLTLPPGTYALALHQDVNNNTRLDRALLGWPVEPYGFSNNPGHRLGAPPFRTCAVAVGTQPVALSIELK